MRIKVTIFLMMAMLLTACSISDSPNESIPVVPTVEGSGIELLITISAEAELPKEDVAVSTPTPTLQPIVTIEPTLTPTNFSPFLAEVWANGVNLRTNPGYLFQTKRLLKENTSVQVLGRTAGNEWIYVVTSENVYGWIYAQLLQSETDLSQAPLVEPGDVFILKGKVTTPDGTPANGIHFAITQGSQRNDAITDESGQFIAFMPLNSSGKWQVSYVAVACISNMMDKDCNCSVLFCGPTTPEVMEVSFPEENLLVFVWE